MNSTSTVAEKSLNQNCILIKSNFLEEIECKYGKTKSRGKLESAKEKAVVIDIFKNQTVNESQRAKITYTIQRGDDKRLNRIGVLRVYNIKEPIDIPVRKLLGNWKNTHIGVTLIAINREWQIEGVMPEHILVKQEAGGLISLQQLLRFVMSS